VVDECGGAGVISVLEGGYSLASTITKQVYLLCS
jgi:acetoin utilization deacetylase AcuC-like enzyme